MQLHYYKLCTRSYIRTYVFSLKLLCVMFTYIRMYVCTLYTRFFTFDTNNMVVFFKIATIIRNYIHTYVCRSLYNFYAKQKHPGCKKVRDQSEAALQIQYRSL